MPDSKKKKGSDPKVDLSPVRVPKSLREAARRKSEKTGIPVAYVQRKAIEDWVKDDPPEDGHEK